jgi:hypothetical protein
VNLIRNFVQTKLWERGSCSNFLSKIQFLNGRNVWGFFFDVTIKRSVMVQWILEKFLQKLIAIGDKLNKNDIRQLL